MTSWEDFEKRRRALKMSRAEMCRRAGVAETTAFKGLKEMRKPSARIAGLLSAVLEKATLEKSDEAPGHE